MSDQGHINQRSDVLKLFAALLLHTSIPNFPGVLKARESFVHAWQEAWWERRPHTQLGPQGGQVGALRWYWRTTGEQL